MPFVDLLHEINQYVSKPFYWSCTNKTKHMCQSAVGQSNAKNRWRTRLNKLEKPEKWRFKIHAYCTLINLCIVFVNVNPGIGKKVGGTHFVIQFWKWLYINISLTLMKNVCVALHGEKGGELCNSIYKTAVSSYSWLGLSENVLGLWQM